MMTNNLWVERIKLFCLVVGFLLKAAGFSIVIYDRVQKNSQASVHDCQVSMELRDWNESRDWADEACCNDLSDLVCVGDPE
ncbi:MAG: hypothetical protein AAGC93_30495 [Cyanobacteria bacterium P01_F01_bin.53]